MELFRKLRTLFGALAHKRSLPPAPRGRAEDRGPESREEGTPGSAARPAVQDKVESRPEEGRVADLIQQQKNAQERGDG